MRVRHLFAALWLFLFVAAAGTATAQNPFAGIWKLSLEKSQLAGDIMTFIPAAGDSMQLTSGGTTYSFRTDGKTYALPSGNAAIWRQTAPDSWSSEYRKLDNKLLSIDNWKLSPDGQTLTVTTSGAKANGDLYTDTTNYARTAGTAGLLGTWKSTTVTLSSPNDLVIRDLGVNRLEFQIPAMKARCDLTMDGKETAVAGPDLPTGLRLSLTRLGPYSLRLVQKLNGTVTSSSVYTLAADDLKTMKEVGGAPGDPPATMIWERQDPPAKVEPPKTNVVGVPVRP
jgi:hypothetical protein